jgi:heterogeneous nuclear ribonucleoprotein F/H
MEVVIKKDERGRPTGNAFVQFESNIDIGNALKYNKKYLRERWVTVEQIEEDEFIRENEEDQKPICKNTETISRHNDKPMETETSNTTFVKLGSLTWSATEEDIKTFLKGCKIRKVVITKNERGKPSGNAFLCLESRADVEKAKTYNRKYLGKRWVTVDEIKEDEYSKETGKDKASGTTVKLGSLSWSATEDDIKRFLVGCNIKEIIITRNEKGKPSGNAFVLFASKADVEKAKTYNKKYLGDRWVTVDEIEEDDYMKETERDRETDTVEDNFCFYLKLSSLPWGATQPEILDLFQNCKIKKVLILRNHLERPSGEAIMEVVSKEDQTSALNQNNITLEGRSVFVKKLNYVELTRNGEANEDLHI